MNEMQPTWNWEAGHDWRGRQALVVGGGESGQATARWLVRQGMRVRLIDSRAQPASPDPDGVDCHWGQSMPFGDHWLDGVDMVVGTPGLSPHPDRLGSVAALRAAALARGIPIVQELDLFDWAISRLASSPGASAEAVELALARPPVLAVTGTNGKTTTVMLLAHLLGAAGMDVQVAGNVSPSLLQALMMREDAGQMPAVWVLELSSFQLALASRFTPTASVLLNVDQDHLDWHLDLEDYRAAKLRIFGLPCAAQTIWVDRDDAALAEAIAAHVSQATPQRFGYGLSPLGAAELGLGVAHEGLDWVVHRASAAEPLVRLMPAAALRIPGPHNLRNAMASLGLALTVTQDLAALLRGLREYRGEPHRLEMVLSIGPVDFVDDSKGTNVDATLAALKAFSGALVVIVGGDGKGQDFSRLVEALAQKGCSVATIGRDGPALAQALRARGQTPQESDDLPQAVRWAHAKANELAEATGHATVLLSPACASFDMFKNYAHRAAVFVEAAREIAQQEGQPC
jgi:UDP-N-acetylmuramoylalanine--D-glutamate ligase